MPIVVQCADCGKRYKLADKLAGRRAKCTACGTMMTVPAAAAAPAAVVTPTAKSVAQPAASTRPAPQKTPMPAKAAAASDPDDFLGTLNETLDAPAPRVQAPPTRSAPAYAPPAAPVHSPYAPPVAGAYPPAYGAPPYSPPLGPPMPVYAPPAHSNPYVVQPRAQRRSDDDGGVSRTRKVIGITLLVVVVGLIVVSLVSAGPYVSGPAILFILAYGMMAGGGLFIVILAFREGVGTGLCCLFVPFYSLIFTLSNLDRTWKPLVCQIAGLILGLGVAFTVRPDDPHPMGAGSVNSSIADSSSNDGGSSGHRSSSGGGRSSFSSGGGYVPPPPPPPDPVHEHVKAALAAIKNVDSADRGDVSRERAMQQLRQLKETLRQERASAVSEVAAANQSPSRVDAAWPEVDREVQQLEWLLTRLPSEAPDPSIFQDAPRGGTAWTSTRAPARAEEISFRTLRLRPPSKGLLDLGSNERDEQKGLVWTRDGETSVTLSIRQTPKTNSRQRQPWLITHGFMAQAAEKDHLLAIDTREMNVTNGTIGGIPFWRAAARQNGASPAVKFIAPLGNDWLIAEISGQPSASSAIADFEDAVRTIRSAPAEAKADPFSPERVAPRLADKPEEALAILQKSGAKAETSVIPMLRSTEPKAAKAAATFLVEYGTAAAIPELRKAADSNDADFAAVARVALRRLSPTDFTPTAEVLLDLKAKEAARRGDAVRRLVGLPPEPAKRQEIATLLENMLLADNSEVDRAAIGAALALWFGDKTVTRLLPILSQEDVDAAKRDAAMEAVSATGNKAAASAVIRWIIKEPEKTVAALIRLGPAAEEATVKIYNNRSFGRNPEDMTIRANCVRVLSEVGATMQSIQVLTRASKDTRDLPTQEIAKQGMEAVKMRIAAAAKSATRPATGT